MSMFKYDDGIYSQTEYDEGKCTPPEYDEGIYTQPEFGAQGIAADGADEGQFCVEEPFYEELPPLPYEIDLYEGVEIGSEFRTSSDI